MRTTLFFSTLALAFGLAACNGCSNERYFCDDTGCYTCDGIGCREVAPPTPEPCVGDYQCADDERCTEDGCIATCSTDGDCPRGTVCNPTSMLCLPPGETPPADKPGVCSRNDDCPSPPAAICVDGLCALDPIDCGTTECACTANTDCDSGYVCAGGRCRPESESCQFNSDCGPSRVCVDGLCYAECGGALMCASGFTCVDGACEPDAPATGVCATNADCTSGQICVDSSCIDGCAVDADCGAGFYCSNAICVVDTRPKPYCTADSQCAAGRTCVEGVCRSPCDTDLQCQMVSGTVPYCRNHLCVTSNEANTNCVTTVDCSGSGIECIDGVCQ